MNAEDPRCPECGGAIGATATYCMHCSSDLTEAKERADTSDDGYWNESTYGSSVGADDGGFLDPDGLLDNALTTVVGIGGGLFIGTIATIVLLIIMPSGWMLVISVPAWLLTTRHLVSRETVQEAVARTAYGVAIVLLLVPFVVFGPSSEGAQLGDRVVVFLVMMGGFAIVAGVVAGIGFAASRFVPEPGDGGKTGDGGETGEGSED